MSATLAIRLPERAEDAAESVLVVDGTPQAAVETGPLEDLARRADGSRLCVLVPGADVLLTRANVPMRGTARILQAVPFALEEQIAADVGELHFAVGKREADGRVPVAAVSRDRIDDWLARLAAVGLHPQTLLSDTAGCPRPRSRRRHPARRRARLPARRRRPLDARPPSSSRCSTSRVSSSQGVMSPVASARRRSPSMRRMPIRHGTRR
jgi:type II secretion system protein L